VDRKLFKEFLDINFTFFSKNKNKNNQNTIPIILNLNSTNIPVVCELMSIVKAVSDVLECRVHVFFLIKYNKDIYKIVKSYFPARTIHTKWLIFYNFILNLKNIIIIAKKINTGKELVHFSINGIEIGKHIYDYILAKMQLPNIDRMTFRYKIYFIVDISFYYAFSQYIHRNKPSCIIFPDIAYRNGIIYEVLKKKTIMSIAGINVNNLSMHKYVISEDYQFSCRTPDKEIIEQVLNNYSIFSKKINNYLNYRISGKEQQHDFLRAYDKGKMIINRTWLNKYLNIDSNKKVVLIMAHIFCDAPHGIPWMLFKDYEDWLIKTCIRLSKNDQINFIVKEHPSAELYKEVGLTEKILSRNGFKGKILPGNINTKSLFNFIDAIVTCGGTAGMEFPCYGVPALIAAKPAYAYFSYIKSPDTLSKYYFELDNIHNYRKLSTSDIRLARAVFYTVNELMQFDKKMFGFGSQNIIRGSKFNINLFLSEMIKSLKDRKNYNFLVYTMDKFLHSKHNNLLDYLKINL